jgi:hypothetical protein
LKRRDVLAGHTERIGRRDLGATRRGGFHAYATTVACECGWSCDEIAVAPSEGGRVAATKAHQAHVDSLLCRDPELVMLHARTAWRDWCPGDGMTYRVRVCRIEGGIADCDKVLLVNCGGRTWAFQFAVTPERQAVAKINADYYLPLDRGVPRKVWADAAPLLRVVGAI